MKTLGKAEIARNEQFLLFPHCFLPVWRTLRHSNQIQNCGLQTLSIWNCLKSVVQERDKVQTIHVNNNVAMNQSTKSLNGKLRKLQIF